MGCRNTSGTTPSATRHRRPPSTATTKSWLSNFGQLRSNTDRHRHVQLALAITLLITAKLIDWRNHCYCDSHPAR